MIKTLFGLNKAGGFKIWTVSAEPIEDYAMVVVVHGQEGGKMQVKVTEVRAGKQGRTVLEQAVNEAAGKLKKQIDKGYREKKEDLEKLPVLAMLAADYRKQGHRITYPCLTSVKYDGVRCLAKCVFDEELNEPFITLESRTGQPYSVPHIAHALRSIMEVGDILDGEIYLHGQVLQDITSAVKRTNPQDEIDKIHRKINKLNSGVELSAGPEEDEAELLVLLEEAMLIAKIRPQLEFHIFDVPGAGVFSERQEALEVVMTQLRDYSAQEASCYLQETHYVMAHNEQDMRRLHKIAVSSGFEGIMLRNLCGLYESGKRSADLQKYKEFLDSEFRVLDVVEDKQDGCIFIMENDLNKCQFGVVIGPIAARKAQLQDKHSYIGKWMTIKYQSRYKRTLLPQFPTGIAFRVCNDDGIPLD